VEIRAIPVSRVATASSVEVMSQEPGFTVEAAHARDKEKTTVYPPQPLEGTPDFDTLRQRVLKATEQTRGNLGDA
jgi:hypothetical protein